MKTFANWMTVIFMIMYWGFRIFITYMFTNGGEYPVKPINLTTEIVILFITFVCIVLVFKRQRVGGFIYFGINMMYYGYELYINITNTIADGGSIDIMGSGLDMFASFLGIIMGIVVLIDILSYNMKTKIDRSTDWYYKNKDLDKAKDAREDSNNYRIY